MPALILAAFASVAASVAGRIVVMALAMAILTTVEAAHASDARVPSASKLERITEFFNNEIATGKLPGAVV